MKRRRDDGGSDDDGLGPGRFSDGGGAAGAEVALSRSNAHAVRVHYKCSGP